MKIRELMTENPVTCSPESPLKDVAQQMVECDCGMIPITDSQEVIGAVTDRDIACRAVAKGRNPLELCAKDVMTAPIVSVSPDANVEQALQLMEQHQIRRLIVADEQGRCCGVVAQADLAQRARPEQAVDVVRGVSKPNLQSAQL